MDGTHFDRLTKLMARNATSRRETIRWLVGTALGGALAASGAHWATGGAAAACKPVGGKCKQDRNCCDGEICGKNGRCKCGPDRKDCDGDKRCETDITGDDDNCGACGNACPDGQVCRDGQCECRFGGPLCGGECCFDGETCCDGLCRDLDEDAGACGSCDRRCNANQICEVGGCCIPVGGSGCTSNRDCCNFLALTICGVGGICERLR